MSPKRFRLSFFLAISSITLYFFIQFTRATYQYFSLKKETPAQIFEWETLPIKDRYVIRAAYQFKADGKMHRGTYTFSTPRYLNEYAAFEALKEKAQRPALAWYNPAKPHSSALERHFPFGLFIKFVICTSIIIYFFGFYKRLVRV